MQDWNKLTVPKLKEELKERGLPITGKKADLVARLQESDKVHETVAWDLKRVGMYALMRMRVHDIGSPRSSRKRSPLSMETMLHSLKALWQTLHRPKNRSHKRCRPPHQSVMRRHHQRQPPLMMRRHQQQRMRHHASASMSPSPPRQPRNLQWKRHPQRRSPKSNPKSKSPRPPQR